MNKYSSQELGLPTPGISGLDCHVCQILPFIYNGTIVFFCQFLCLRFSVGVFCVTEVVFAIFELNTTVTRYFILNSGPKNGFFRSIKRNGYSVDLISALVPFDFAIFNVQGIAVLHFPNSSHVNHFLFLLSKIKCKDRRDFHAICKLKADYISCQFQLPRVLWTLVQKCQCSICHFQAKCHSCP